MDQTEKVLTRMSVQSSGKSGFDVASEMVDISQTDDMMNENNNNNNSKGAEIKPAVSPKDIVIDQDLYKDDDLRNKMDQILMVPGNCCAECGDKAEWGSINLGALLCIKCSGIHRNLGTHISRVKSLYLDNWKREELTSIRDIGSRNCNDTWELNMLMGIKPSKDDSVPYREAFIKAKYERKEFHKEAPSVSSMVDVQGFPHKEGTLTKRGKVVKSWKSRFFVLSGSMLFYYKKAKDKTPAGVICFSQTVGFRCLEDAIEGHHHLFTIQTRDREFMISAENQKVMFQWVAAMKHAQTIVIPANPVMQGKTVDDFNVKELYPMLLKDLREIHKTHGALKKDCFHAANVVDWFVVTNGIDRPLALELGKKLVSEVPTIKPLTPTQAFQDSDVMYMMK